MTTKMQLTRDQSGNPTYGRRFSDAITRGTLVASTATNITSPVDASIYQVILNYTPGASVWVRVGDTAVLPTSPASGNEELNPSSFWVNAQQTVSLITSGSNVQFSASFYDIEGSN